MRSKKIRTHPGLIQIKDKTQQVIHNNRMKSRLITLALGALVFGAARDGFAQYAPPPAPAPFPGFINEALRKNDPYMNLRDRAHCRSGV